MNIYGNVYLAGSTEIYGNVYLAGNESPSGAGLPIVVFLIIHGVI